MHEHLSTKSEDTLTCFTAAIDWPVEMVYAEAWILPFDRYNPLEQAVLQILERFRDHLPSLKDAAEKLGIMDPVFIEAILHQMIEKGILEKTDTSSPLNFAGCRINTSFSQRENKSPAIEKHGVQFCFDAVTSEHIPVPPEAFTDCPTNPVIEPKKLPAHRTHLGLDKARQLAEKQREPFMSESAGLIELTVLPERGKYLWQTLPVTCSTQHDGSLRCQIEQESEQQQEWLDQLDTKHPLFRKLQIRNSEKRVLTTN